MNTKDIQPLMALRGWQMLAAADISLHQHPTQAAHATVERLEKITAVIEGVAQTLLTITTSPEPLFMQFWQKIMTEAWDDAGTKPANVLNSDRGRVIMGTWYQNMAEQLRVLTRQIKHGHAVSTKSAQGMCTFLLHWQLVADWYRTEVRLMGQAA